MEGRPVPAACPLFPVIGSSGAALDASRKAENAPIAGFSTFAASSFQRVNNADDSSNARALRGTLLFATVIKRLQVPMLYFAMKCNKHCCTVKVFPACLMRAEAELQRAADHFLPSSSESEQGSDGEEPSRVPGSDAPATGSDRKVAARRSEHAKRKRKKDKCAPSYSVTQEETVAPSRLL